jgi:WhiB family redox-sensing transcriptional regulator
MYALIEPLTIDIEAIGLLAEPITASVAIDAIVTVRAPQARCADGNGTLTHLFFSDEAIDVARAKAICAKCRLTESCLEGALERAEPWGVWGGELIENGRVVRNKRPRGRPPKHPRPALVVDEVPIPPHLLLDDTRGERVA